jgi:phage-related holin
MDYIRANHDKCIGTEIPIYIFATRGYLTGHIDLLLFIGDTLYVCDYKPGEMVNTRQNDKLNTAKNMITSVPQISTYAIAIVKMLGLDLNKINVKCVFFNENYQMVYDPVPILKEILVFVKNQNYAHMSDWTQYSDILGI